MAARFPHLPRLAVLGSGAGSNFVAIADAIAAGVVHAEVVLVVSDVAEARILQHAADRGLPGCFLDPGPYKTRLADSAQEELARRLRDVQADVIVCAGFMRRLKAPVLTEWAGRIVNIHPSLLPQFPGRDAIPQALAAGVPVTGCTVHLVTEDIDAGPILARQEVAVEPGDTAASLTPRINAAERALYPATLQRWLHGGD
jgi:phosphoribosylglycinamide formyltransferase 1